jgi:uncharacterized protein (DUF2267 family)
MCHDEKLYDCHYLDFNRRLIVGMCQKKKVHMNKSELVKRVAKKLDDLPRKIAAKAVDAVFQSIQEGLEEDGIVKIGQWGTYTVDDLE